ncbi:MAG: PAS domain-containing protein [Cyclobacteriaceae bacterium]
MHRSANSIESLSEYLAFIDHLPGMTFLEVVGEKIYFNEAARLKLGLTESSLSLNEWQKLIGKEGFYRRQEVQKKAAWGMRPEQLSYTLTKPQGKAFRIREIVQKKVSKDITFYLGSAHLLEGESSQPLNQADSSLHKNILDTINFGVEYLKALRDESGRVVDFEFSIVSKNAYLIIDRKRDLGPSLIGRRLLDVFPEFPEHEFNKYVQVMETGNSFKAEFFYPMDENRKWYEQQVSRLGEGIVLVYECIEDRKKIQEQIFRSNELLASLFDSTAVGIDVLEAIKNDEGKIVDFRYIKSNRQAQVVHQAYDIENIENSKLSVSYPAVMDSPLFEMLVRVLKTGRTYRDEIYFQQNEKNMWFFTNYIKFGEGLVITHLDISETKNASLELKKSNELIEGIFNTSSAAIEALEAVRDESGRIIDFVYIRTNHKSKMIQTALGRSATEGASLLELYPNLKTNGLFQQLVDVVEKGETIQMEVPFQLEGQIQWYLSNYGKSGEHGLILTYMEITQMKKAEEKLKDALHIISLNNRNLIRMIDSTDDYISSITPDFRLSAFNRVFATEMEALTGRKIEVGMDVLSIFDDFPENRKKIKQKYKKALSGKSVSAPSVYHLASGETILYETSYHPIYGQGEQVIGAAVFVKNITSRQRTEKALKDAREFLLLAENLPQIIFTINSKGQVEYINQAFSRITGISPDDISTQKLMQLLHPEDRDKLLELWRHRMSGKQKVDAEMRCRLLYKQKEYRWMLLRVTPVIEANGQLHSWIASASDMHQTIENEMLQRKAAEEFRQIAEGMPQIVFVADEVGSTNYFNKQWYEYTGSTPATSLGGEWLHYIHPYDRKRASRIWNEAVKQKLPYLIEYRIQGADKKYRWFLTRAIPLMNQQDKVVKWFGTCTNIESQKQQQQMLEQRNKQLTELNEYLENFVNAVAHDLRSPVANIKGLIEVLKNVDNEMLQAKVMDKLGISVETLDRTVVGLIQLVEAQKLQEEMVQPIAVKECFIVVKKEFESLLSEFKHEIELEVTDRFKVLFVKPYLESAFRNLLSNAIKYRKYGEPLRLKLSAKKGKKYDILTFSDNGIGIDLVKYGRQLFKPFSRFTNYASGKGVGLHIINQMLRREGGKIEVESQPGEGATFKLYIKRW